MNDQVESVSMVETIGVQEGELLSISIEGGRYKVVYSAEATLAQVIDGLSYAIGDLASWDEHFISNLMSVLLDNVATITKSLK